MPSKFALRGFLFLIVLLMLASAASASHISGIRITQTGNTGLMINIDVTGFYTTGSTESTMYLGTYYNQVPAVDWGDGSTVPRYGYGPSTGIPLVATSTVVNGIPARAYRGSFSHTYGSAGGYTISANTYCCPLTTPTYTLVSGTILTTSFTTSTPFSTMATITESFIQNTLPVNIAAPGFSKAFASTTVAVGIPNTLTFTIDNTASTLDDNALAFVDNLPASVTVAAVPNVTNTCTGGTLTAAAGSGVISYTGGLVTAGSSCTISVDVGCSLPGVHVNTTGDLTSSFGNSGTASDTVTCTAVPPGFSKAFSPASVGVGIASTLTFTIDNTANAAVAPALDFTDNLPANVVVASVPNASTTCTGGTLTAVAGSGVISYTGGSVAASGSCTISVDVSSDLPGVYVNTTGDLTSSFGNSGTAGDTLTVTAVAPGFSKAFSPVSVGVGIASTLTFTIDNTANAASAPALDFTDNLPANVVVASTPNASTTCTGGTLTAAAGSGVISYTGGSVVASGSCTISVDVSSDLPGVYVNTTGDLTSSFGNSGTAGDTLTVTAVAPGFSKAFSPATQAINTPSTLTFTLDNTANAAAAVMADFSDNLPAGLVVSSPSNVANTCTGGTLTAVSGTSVISYTGGSVPTSSICTISADVESATSGVFNNVTGDLTSAFGNSGPATADLTIVGPPGFTKAFTPDSVGTGLVSTLILTIDNTANPLGASSLDFTDPLPAGLTVATPGNAVTDCTGGTVTAADGSTSISYTGGSVAAGASCTVSVDIANTAAGSYLNDAGPLTSGLGDSGNATATLTVNDPPLFTKAFDPTTIPPGGTTALTFVVDNSASTVDATMLDFTDNLPLGMTVANPANVVDTCTGGTVTADPGTAVISYTGGTVAAGAVCTISVDVTANQSGTFTNVADPLTSNLGSSGTATAVDVLEVFNTVDIPTQSPIGLTVLGMLLALLGLSVLRRR